MILNQRLEEVLSPQEVLLAELQGDLDIPAINALQQNGRLIATNKRLLFYCEVGEQIRYDSFYYENIERIVMRHSFKNEPRILFEADDEIQMLHNIKVVEDIPNFLEMAEKHVKR